MLFYTNPSAFLYSLVQLLSTIEGFRVTAFLAVVVPMLYSVMAVCHATADVSGGEGREKTGTNRINIGEQSDPSGCLESAYFARQFFSLFPPMQSLVPG